MATKPKYKLSDWFFAHHGDRPTASVKTRLSKLVPTYPAPDGEYKKAENKVSLEHARPRKFRRGRIHWTTGGQQVGQFRWKFWTTLK